MIKKNEIISILIDYGLSGIESERSLDTKRNFKLVIEDLLDKAVTDEWKPTKKLYTQKEYNDLKKIINLLRSHLKKCQNRSLYKDRKARMINRQLKFIRDRIDYLMKHNFTRVFRYK